MYIETERSRISNSAMVLAVQSIAQKAGIEDLRYDLRRPADCVLADTAYSRMGTWVDPWSRLIVKVVAHSEAMWTVEVCSSPAVEVAEVVESSEHAAVVEFLVQLDTQVLQSLMVVDTPVARLSLVERTRMNNSICCYMGCGVEVAPFQTTFALQMVEKPVMQAVLVVDAKIEQAAAALVRYARKMSRPVLQIMMEVIEG